MANLTAAPPDLKCEAPDPAATGSSAKVAYQAGEQETHTGSATDRQCEATIAHYLNEGWDGTGWAPYSLLTIGESVFATRPTRRGHFHPDGPADAADFRSIVLAEARRRWLAGFYADPFAKAPQRRPDAYRRAAA